MNKLHLTIAMFVLCTLSTIASADNAALSTRVIYLDGWYSFYMVGDPDEKCFGKNITNAAGNTEMNSQILLGKNLLAASDLSRCGNALPESLAKGWRIKQFVLSQMPGAQTAAAGYVILEK